MRLPCETCKGGGTVPEHHGPGLTEYLSCPDCRGTGAGREVLLVPVDLDKVADAIHPWICADPSEGIAANAERATGAIIAAVGVIWTMKEVE